MENRNYFCDNLMIFRSTGKSQKDFLVSKARISWQKCLFGVGSYFIIYIGRKTSLLISHFHLEN